jgi:tetratricopeptide (TPR) repeat protein
MIKNDFLVQRLSDIFFIELNKDLGILNKGLYLPLMFSDLKDQVTTDSEQINQKNIFLGMLYINGLDPEFKYISEYKEILEHLGKDVIDELTILILSSNHNIEDKYILMSGLYNYYKNENTYFNCGKLAFENSQEDGKYYLNYARKIFENLLEKEFKNDYLHYYLGFIHYNMHQFKKAFLNFEHALELNIDESSKLELLEIMNKLRNKLDYEQGYEFILSGRIDEGLELLVPLLEEFDEWWNLLFFVGLGYRFKEDYDKAIYYFDRAKNIEKNNTDIMNELGISYTMSGQYDLAIDILEKASVLSPNTSFIICNLGIAYYQKGELIKAKELIENAYELDKEDEINQKWLSFLNENS